MVVVEAGFVAAVGEGCVGAGFQAALDLVAHVVILIANGAEDDVAEALGGRDLLRRFGRASRPGHIGG